MRAARTYSVARLEPCGEYAQNHEVLSAYLSTSDSTITAGWAAPRSAVEVACSVHMFVQHCNIHCKYKFVSNITLFSEMVVEVKRHLSEE